MVSKYFDFAATAPLLPISKKILIESLDDFYNPNSDLKLASKIYDEIEIARQDILKTFDTNSMNLIFTKSGTESNNIAIKGYIFRNHSKIKHIIIGSVEHPSILEIFKDEFIISLLKNAKIDYLKIDKNGCYDLDHFKKIITKETNLVCLMKVNNELGSINEISEFYNLLKSKQTFFYSDFTQAIGKISIQKDVKFVDAFGFSGHKIGALKESGALVFKKKLFFQPLISGSKNQELGLSPGTQYSTKAIILSQAVKTSMETLETSFTHINELRKKCIELLTDYKINFEINTDLDKSIPHILSLRIKGIKADALRKRMNLIDGYMFSLGSACSEKSDNDKKVNNVLKNLGLNLEEQKSTIRLSFCKEHTNDDLHGLIKSMHKSYNFIKVMVPL